MAPLSVNDIIPDAGRDAAPPMSNVLKIKTVGIQVCGDRWMIKLPSPATAMDIAPLMGRPVFIRRLKLARSNLADDALP